MSTYRDLTADSLWRGWWGKYSLVINPVMMLANLYHRIRIGALDAPRDHPWPPMPPGKPLYRRWQIVGFAVPAAVTAFVISAITIGIDPQLPAPPKEPIPAWALGPTTTSAPPTWWVGSAKTGECVYNTKSETWGDDPNPDLQPAACTDPRAQVEVLGTASFLGCQPDFPTADAVIHIDHTGPMTSFSRTTLCVRVLR
ncbi:hypothetical protein [Nocardia ignorata]|uniref:hypothetical protein n=1 Tax=Nocardia ignorata TaxID=145285 RepID=UPI000834F623|nr:hypothetical protein [Nocardia ignorata]